MSHWILVAGGFHAEGGMDRLNASLAHRLLERGNTVTLVCFRADEFLQRHPAAMVYEVARPLGSFFLGHLVLAWQARRLIRGRAREGGIDRIIVNGGNCACSSVNWVHYVHGVYAEKTEAPSCWWRWKNRLVWHWEVWREKVCLRLARRVVANSQRTKQDVMALGVPEGKIDVVYPAEDWENQPELESRSETASSPGPVVFLGGLGFDQRKGFDLLIEAWEMLVRDGDWDLSLIVAGGGPAVNHWRERLARNSWADRIELRGFQRDPRALLQSAEILVSPVRYEPYGLNVYEALCLGRPAIVTESAGVAEHYQGKWKELLLPAPPRAEEVAQRLRHWRAQRDFWRKEAELRAPFFRQRDSRMMADEIIAMVQKTFGENTPPNQPDDGKNRDLSGSRIESIRDAG